MIAPITGCISVINSRTIKVLIILIALRAHETKKHAAISMLIQTLFMI